MVTSVHPRTSTSVVVMLAGGDPVDASLAAAVPAGAVVIAADSGLAAAAVLGVAVDLVIGDLDSVDPDDLAAARAAGVPIERHPEAKDATDLELAMDAAAAHGPDRIVVLGGHGGRLDHLLGGIALLASPAYADIEVVAHLGPATLTVIRRAATITGAPGAYVSLLPVHGPARGVVTDGLLYPLLGEDLEPGSTRGVSNEFARPTATIRLTAGVVIAVQPGGSGTHLTTHGAIQP